MSSMKNLLEQEIEKICTCGTGGCLDSHEHDMYCGAWRILVELGY